MNAVRTMLAMVAALLVAGAAALAHADRYWVERFSGKTLTGERLTDFANPSRGPVLDGRALADNDDPVRMLRDTSLVPLPLEAHLELVNGDLFAGKILEAKLGTSTGGSPAHFLVGATLHSGPTRVRLDWVRRINTQHRASRPYLPNFLALVDGRQFVARSLRVEADGVRALTDEGIVAVKFDRIAELHLAPPAASLPPLPGATLFAGDAPPVLRMLTDDGEVLTVPRGMLQKLDTKSSGRRAMFFLPRRPPRRRAAPPSTLVVTRPAWSLDSIAFDETGVVCATWLAGDEIPLSLLPVAAVEKKAALHHRLWQLQRSVAGELLSTTDGVAELGVGMHSFSRLTFTLPPHALTFSSRVGFDRAVKGGGCVHLRVWRDEPAGEPLWERKFLRGSDGPQQVGPLAIAGATQLILEVDFADEGRPAGADPLDIRDWINWLLPLVKVDAERTRADGAQLAQLIPALEGWTLAPEQAAKLRLRPAWIKRDDYWSTAFDSPEPVVFSRELDLGWHNAWLPVCGARAEDSRTPNVARVRVAGEKVASTMNGDLGTHDRGKFAERIYVLPQDAEQPAKIEVIVEPHDKGEERVDGFVWSSLALEPLVRNLPADQQPIEPEVPLTALAPQRTRIAKRNDGEALLAGQYASGIPLAIHGWHFADGYGLPTGSVLTYELDPAWRSFVAVIGLCDGWAGAGPYQILLDDELHWTSDHELARNDPAEQIVVPLPPGRKTITLRLLGKDSGGAWANAGFMTDDE